MSTVHVYDYNVKIISIQNYMNQFGLIFTWTNQTACWNYFWSST